MKVKTRILAMLLTALTVIGILPLSLFAAGVQGPVGSTVQAPYKERTLDDVKKEFEKTGFDLDVYEDFSNVSTLATGNNTIQNGLAITNTNGVFSVENGTVKRTQSVAAAAFLDLRRTELGKLEHCDYYLSFDVKMGEAVAVSDLFTFVSRPNGSYTSFILKKTER